MISYFLTFVPVAFLLLYSQLLDLKDAPLPHRKLMLREDPNRLIDFHLKGWDNDFIAISANYNQKNATYIPLVISPREKILLRRWYQNESQEVFALLYNNTLCVTLGTIGKDGDVSNIGTEVSLRSCSDPPTTNQLFKDGPIINPSLGKSVHYIQSYAQTEYGHLCITKPALLLDQIVAEVCGSGMSAYFPINQFWETEYTGPSQKDEGRIDEGRSDKGRNDEGRNDEQNKDEGQKDEVTTTKVVGRKDESKRPRRRNIVF